MRKLSVLLWMCAAFLFATPVSAQFKWGLEGGVNMSKAKISKSAFDSSNRTGWFIGPKAQFSVPVIPIAVDGAILYSQKYLKIDNEETSTPNKSLPYVEIPINLKYNIGFSSLVGAYISTGPQYSWYVGSRNIGTVLGSMGSLERSTFSWNVGVGINALKHLQLGVTYNIALGETGEVHGIMDATQKIDMKNNTWQVRLAYMF